MDSELSDLERLRERVGNLGRRACEVLSHSPETPAAQALVQEMIRACGETSQAFRLACRVKSRQELGPNLLLVVEVAERAVYWVGLAEQTGWWQDGQLAPLVHDTREAWGLLSTYRPHEPREEKSEDQRSSRRHSRRSSSR